MMASSYHITARVRGTHSRVLAVGASCIGLLLQRPSPCYTEAGQRGRKRPPKFGSFIPTLVSRDIVSSPINIDDVKRDREDCPMCKKFGSGPCGGIFKRWLDCTDRNPGKDADGQPMHLSKCTEFAIKLSKCLDDHADFYIAYDDKHKHDKDEGEETLRDAWSQFVSDTEEQISSHVYKLMEFPKNISPIIQVRLETKTGAAYFKPETGDGRSIIAAYIIDDSGNVMAAGAKDDMDMGNQLGCVLIFELPDGIKSATCRAIYDDDDVVTIFSKNALVPVAIQTK